MIPGKRISVLGLVFLGGVVTTLVVCGVAAYFVAMFFIDGYLLGNAVETQQKIYILKDIKEGKLAGAVERLERGVDTGLIGLEKDSPTKRTGEAVLKTISLAKEYRTEYPRKSSNPEIDSTVKEIFSGNAQK